MTRTLATRLHNDVHVTGTVSLEWIIVTNHADTATTYGRQLRLHVVPALDAWARVGREDLTAAGESCRFACRHRRAEESRYTLG